MSCVESAVAHFQHLRYSGMVRPPRTTTVSAEREAALKQLTSRPTTPQNIAQRARMILALGAGEPAGDVAARFGVSRALVYRWRQRFEQGGVGALGPSLST